MSKIPNFETVRMRHVSETSTFRHLSQILSSESKLLFYMYRRSKFFKLFSFISRFKPEINLRTSSYENNKCLMMEIYLFLWNRCFLSMLDVRAGIVYPGHCFLIN